MRKHLLLLMLLLGLLAARLLQADVTKQTYVKLKTASGMFASEQTSTTAIRPNMKTDDELTSVSAVVGKRSLHQGRITRLDKDVCWDLDHGAKTYRESEIKLPEFKGKIDTEVEGKPDTTRNYRIVKSEFTVKKLDSARTINSFLCNGYVGTWTLVVEEIKTKKQSASIMTLTMWTTTPTDAIKQVQAEEAAFDKAYLAKLKADAAPEQSTMMGAEYLMTLGMTDTEMREGLKKAGEEMAKIQGYPIVTEIKWEVPVDTSARKKSESEPESRDQSGLPNISGMLNKALEKKFAPNPAEAGVVFSSYLEVKSIKVDPVPDKDFEVPEGYKKL
jgi:hypothetical protein